MTSVSGARIAAGARTRPSALPAIVGRRHALEWFGGGAALAFVVSFVGADVLELHHHLYLLIYFTIVGTFLATFFALTKACLLDDAGELPRNGRASGWDAGAAAAQRASSARASVGAAA
jgi:hypothetical protein